MSSHSGVRGPPKGFPLFSALRMASSDTIILLIMWTIMQPSGTKTAVVPPCLRPCRVGVGRGSQHFGSARDSPPLDGE